MTGSGPGRLLMIAAVLLPLALIALSAWALWHEAWRRAEGEIQRTADGAGEYAARVLGAQVLAGSLVNQMLAGLPDEAIRAQEADLQERLTRFVPRIPMINTIGVIDRAGGLLLLENVRPVPAISVADGEWMDALRSDGALDVHISGMLHGRISGMLYFGVSIRRTDTGNAPRPDGFDGAITLSVDPNRLAAGFLAITQGPDDVIALVRTDGEILVLSPGVTERPPPVPASSPLIAAATAGLERGRYEGQARGIRASLPIGQRLLVAYRRVADLPVYITVTRPPHAVLRAWQRQLAGLLAVGLPATLLLGVLVLGVRRGQHELEAGEAEFRAAFEGSAVGNALFAPQTGEVCRVNQRLCEVMGRSEDALLGATLDALAPGRDCGQTSGTARIARPDGTGAWVQVDIAPIRYGARGLPPLSIASFQDVTERRESEARHRMLAKEVDHRAKNALAVVQSIVRLSAAPSVTAYLEAVRGRVMVLARAHELLSRTGWSGIGVRMVVEEAVSGAGQRLSARGPDVTLGVDAVQPLAMALHELAANAELWGALSVPGGSASLEWDLVAPEGGEGAEPVQPVLRLCWSEEGGPGVVATPAPRSGPAPRAGLKFFPRLFLPPHKG
ncbi:hypothetical protein BH23PSE1_BH23PSE1_08540 [soil metagenome]